MELTKSRFLVSIVFGFCFSINLSAVPAYPKLVEIVQPDGYVLKVRMKGDEYHHWVESEEGYTLLYNQKGYLTLAMPDSKGDLQPSKYRFRNKAERNSTLEREMRTVGKHAAFSQRQLSKAILARQESRARSRASISGQPVIGKRKYLVVLMEFPDLKFTHTKEEFHALMNEKGYTVDGNQGSVRDFYYENSFGQLELESDVAGVYKAKHEMAYYGNNITGVPQELAIEAMEAAAADYDLTQYDCDHDGYIDGIHVIFSGYGEDSGAGEDYIWSHESRASLYFCTFDGVKMKQYSCTPELRGASGTGMSYIGPICHEIGHALGTMDFYDVDYATGGSYSGSGMWDVMGSGSWNGDGACPAHFNPYTKIFDFQWSDIMDGNKAISTKLEDKTKGQYIGINTQTDGEAFFLEYRKQSGFDSFLPGHGLLVWHASDYLNNRFANTINSTHPQQFYPLVANCTVDIPNDRPSSYGNVNSSFTPFPGTGDVTELTDETTPSMKNWKGENTEFPITNIVEHETEGYVEFDICGGDYGNAYNLSVTESTMNTLKLAWKAPQPDTKVMLLSNEEDVFGSPTKATYTEGEQLENGGKVVYVGTETEFLHQGLKEHTTYCYRLCTWHEAIGAWTVNGSRKGKTKTGITSTFPYCEDFEKGYIEDDWEVEITFGSQNHWVVDKPYGWGNSYFLMFDPKDGFAHQTSQIMLPIMNFEGKKSAFLSFDYINWIKSAKVMYRVSADSPWILLKQLDNHYKQLSHLNYDNENRHFLSTMTHVDILLPELSSEYQLCFFGEFQPRDNTINYTEKLIIDNVTVSVNLPGFVNTRSISSIGKTTASVLFDVEIEKTVTIQDAGVEYSTNQVNWKRVSSTSGLCQLVELSSNTQYYCRGYARTSGGYIYGNTESFVTLPSFYAGSGTQEDPIQIGSIDDWNIFRNYVNNDNNCEGSFFVLKKSLTLNDNEFIYRPFCGKFDGGGHTLSIDTEGIVQYYICELGEKGEICNLRLSTGALVMVNYGTIHDCDVNFEQEFSKLENAGIFGFIASNNFGTIYSCHVNIKSAYFVQGYIGGICGYNNTGIISLCTSNGSMSVNNNANLGGIAGLNCCGGSEYGTISQCVNKATLSTKLIDGRAWYCTIGGIAGGTYGTIEQSYNQGAISVGCSSDMWDDAIVVGGIVGRIDHSSGLVRDCYNIGAIMTSFNNDNMSNFAGGIAGENYLANINNSLSLGEVISTTVYGKYNHGVVGKNNQATVTHCFYTGTIDDAFAEKVTNTELVSQSFVDDLNDNAGMPVWALGTIHPVLLMETDDVVITIDNPQNVFAHEATLSGLAIGNIENCGIEWREEGDEEWRSIPIEKGKQVTVKLDNLKPATLYECRVFAQTSKGRRYSFSKLFATEFTNKGTKENPILLRDLYGLRVFRQSVHQGNQYDNQVIKLMADIDLEGDKGVLWEPITQKVFAAFSGEFDGNGHVIRNMKVIRNAASAGFFGTTYKCYIHDLTIINGTITNSELTSTGNSETLMGSYAGGVGGIIGDCITYDGNDLPLVEKCSFTGTIDGSKCTGGIVGNSLTYEVKDCYAIAAIKYSGVDYANIGGITGNGNVRGAYFAGSITSLSGGVSIGRITGDYTSVVTDSYYQQSDEYTNVDYGTALSERAMKDGTLLSKLPEDIWTSDNIMAPVNQGYPMLMKQSAPHIWITDYEVIGDDKIQVNGMFYGAERDYAMRGVEYSSKHAKTNVVQVIGETDLRFSAIIPYVPAKYIAFRAFARDNDSMITYSDWVDLNIKFIVGDANGDGNVNKADIDEVVNYIMDNPSEDFFFPNADTNGDEVVNAADIVEIVNRLPK